MKFIIKKNILTAKLIDKIHNSLNEKRFIKSVLKKIYPYIKGIIYIFLFKKNEVKIVYNEKNTIKNEDNELIKKLFNFYKTMKEDQNNTNKLYSPSSLWQNHIDRDFSYLNNALKNNSIKDFTFFLQNFGNWKFDLGILSHFSKKYSKNFILKKFLSNELFYGQLKRWEYFNQNESSISALDMPRHGNLNGAIYKNNFIVFGAPNNHIYSKIIKNYLTDDKRKIIVELGAGFGTLPYYYLKDLKNFTFFDFDIPEVLLLASYYLIKSFPNKKYFLYGDETFSQNIQNQYELIFLPTWEIEKIQKNSVDITINKNSLGEINPDSARNYINNIHRFSKYFFSMNHEFQRNQFENNKFSLINNEYNLNDKFKELIRYPDFGHLLNESNIIDFNSDIFFYIYEKNNF